MFYLPAPTAPSAPVIIISSSASGESSNSHRSRYPKNVFPALQPDTPSDTEETEPSKPTPEICVSQETSAALQEILKWPPQTLSRDEKIPPNLQCYPIRNAYTDEKEYEMYATEALSFSVRIF